MVARESVVPLNNPNMGGIILGGPNFLKGYKLCKSCGLVLTFNLTMLGYDPNRAPT